MTHHKPHVFNVVFLSLLFFLTFFLTACEQQKPQEGELRIGLAQLPMSLDPRFATDAASHKIQDLLHRGLVHLDDQWLPRPDLACSWEHPTPLTWVFQLKKNIYFHDGSAVTAVDVKATLDAMLDPKLASPLQAGFAAIASVEVNTPQMLTIHLKKPDSSFLTRLAIGIVPASLAKKPHQPHDMMGCGAFKLERWHGNDLVLKRVEKSPQSNINFLHFIRVKDAVTRSLKLVRGEIDLAQNDLPPELLPYLTRQKHLNIQTKPSTTFAYLGLNMQDPILQHLRVRQALALSIDRKKLKKALFSDLPLLAESVLSPKHWAATKLPMTAFDPQKAEKLLDDAGFPRGDDGVRFHLTYRTSTNATRLRLATAIVDMWQKIGVKVSLESLEWGGFYARIKRGDFQVFSLSWVAIVDPDIYRWILHSDMWPPKGANRGRYKNPDVDQWLEKALSSESITMKQYWYAQVQKQMHADQVYIPLWYEPVIAVANQKLHGFVPSSDGSFSGLIHAQIEEE